MKYMTTKQAADKWNISSRRISLLCSEGRIEGAVKAGKTWLIPEDCQKPMDKRFKTMHYKIEEYCDLFLSDTTQNSLVRTDLVLDSYVVRCAEKYFSENGKSLSEGVNELLSEILSNRTRDFTSTYPREFFSLFGTAAQLGFPENLEDFEAEDVVL